MKSEKQAHSPDDFHFRHRYPEHWQPAKAHHVGFKDPTHVEFYDPQSQLHLQWHSRAHRKGKLPKAVTPAAGSSKPEPQQPVKHEKRFPRLLGVDIKDISWHVAFLFLFGSVFWCINGVMFFDFFVVSTNAIANAEAATAFLGGTFFLVGGYLGFVESLNPSRDLEFGYEIDEEARKLRRPSGPTTTSLGRSRNHFGKHQPSALAKADPTSESGTPEWRWWGADWHSIGYVANTIQLFGATIFWVSTLCGLPGILPESGASLASGLSAKSIALWEVFYWVPQVIGAPCFVISGALFMLECSKKWYKPEIPTLGWQIGFWNFIGGWGFWMCGIFGIMRETGGSESVQQWGTAFSTWWGSWAFLLGSYLQFYETLNK